MKPMNWNVYLWLCQVPGPPLGALSSARLAARQEQGAGKDRGETRTTRDAAGGERDLDAGWLHGSLRRIRGPRITHWRDKG